MFLCLAPSAEYTAVVPDSSPFLRRRREEEAKGKCVCWGGGSGILVLFINTFGRRFPVGVEVFLEGLPALVVLRIPHTQADLF